MHTVVQRREGVCFTQMGGRPGERSKVRVRPDDEREEEAQSMQTALPGLTVLRGEAWVSS